MEVIALSSKPPLAFCHAYYAPDFISGDSARSDKENKWGCLNEAIRLAENKQHNHGISVTPNFAFRLMLECMKQQDKDLGRRLHALMVCDELDCIPNLGELIIRFYGSCGDLLKSKQAFNKISQPIHSTWNATIYAHSKLGQNETALQFYDGMQHQGALSDKFTFISILKACSNGCNIWQGRQLHTAIIDKGLQFDVAIGSTIVDMYAKCGSLEEAREAFDRLTTRDVVTWGTIIAGYAQHGEGNFALECFEHMHQEGIKPDKVIFLSILKACSSIGALEHGKCTHEQICESGLHSDSVIGSAIVHMYGRCGSFQEAKRVFDHLRDRTALIWNAIISASAEQDEIYLAFAFFDGMQQENARPDKFTFFSILKICNSTEQGRRIHEHIIQNGLQCDVAVVSTILDMYARCGSLEEARRLFDTFPNRNAVSWNVIIAGYAEHDEGILGLECFENMLQKGIRPDKFTFSSVFKMCGNTGAMEKGRAVQEQVAASGLQGDNVLGSTLVEMYIKCGDFQKARTTFSELRNRDVVAWNAMIAGYAQLGEASLAVHCFNNMQHDGVYANEMTFSLVLTAYSCAGLVNEGIRHLRIMREIHGIRPNLFHVTCMVDLLGQAACFKEAEILFDEIVHPDICLCLTLLSACKLHGNVILGRRCFDEVVKLDPSCAAAYVLISNIYAMFQMLEDNFKVDMTRDARECCHVKANLHNPKA